MTRQHSQSPALHRKPDSHARRSTGYLHCLTDFRAALEQHNGNNTTALSNTDRIGELEAEITALRERESDEPRDLRAANRNMAQHIQAFSLVVREQDPRHGSTAAPVGRLARTRKPCIGRGPASRRPPTARRP